MIHITNTYSMSTSYFKTSNIEKLTKKTKNKDIIEKYTSKKKSSNENSDENGDVINGIWKKNKIFEIISKNGEIMN